jgi:hypothetical protein
MMQPKTRENESKEASSKLTKNEYQTDIHKLIQRNLNDQKN